MVSKGPDLTTTTFTILLQGSLCDESGTLVEVEFRLESFAKVAGGGTFPVTNPPAETLANVRTPP